MFKRFVLCGFLSAGEWGSLLSGLQCSVVHKLTTTFSKGIEMRKWKIAGASLAVATLAMTPALASAQSLNTTDFNVDIASYITAVAVTIAGLVGGVLGVYFLIQIVKGGMQWIKSYATK